MSRRGVWQRNAWWGESHWSYALVGPGLVAALISGCVSNPPPRGHPLYPTSPLKPRSEVAQLSGPIVAVDGNDVRTLGGRFEVLPGCHIVEVQPPNQSNDYVLVYANTGPIPFAVNTRAGHSYTIRSEFVAAMGSVRLVLEGAEHDAAGAKVGTFEPARSTEELQGCAGSTE